MVPATVVAVLALTACDQSALGTPTGQPVVTTTPKPAPDLDAPFRSANAAAPWIGSVTQVALGGKVVFVRTTLSKQDRTDAVAICDAARDVADDAGADFVSVTVQSVDDAPIGTWNKLRGEAACRAG